jgi:hypothetical protein
LVNLVFALAYFPFATVLVSVVDKALALALVIVSLVFLVAASLAGAMVVGSIAAIGHISDDSDISNVSTDVLNRSSEGGQAGGGLEQEEREILGKKLTQSLEWREERS